MKAKETIALPTEAFALLIKSSAQAVINEFAKPAPKVDIGFLHGCVETLDELIGKFEILHHKEHS